MSDSLRPHGLHSPRNSLGQKTGAGCLSLLQGILPTQGSNPGLPHCRRIFYHLRHRGSPRNTGVGSLSLFQWISLTQESNRSLLHCRRILYQLSYQGSSKPIRSKAIFLRTSMYHCIPYTHIRITKKVLGTTIQSNWYEN